MADVVLNPRHLADASINRISGLPKEETGTVPRDLAAECLKRGVGVVTVSTNV
jgi:hypothetical protein